MQHVADDRILYRHWCNTSLCWTSDVINIPSAAAENLFPQYDVKTNGVNMICCSVFLFSPYFFIFCDADEE
jgi:hypothetical protein